MVFGGKDYREVLRGVFEDRHRRNPSYSLRSFARDLRISASLLSEVMNGHHGLSPTSAKKIAERLGLTEEETELFLAMVAFKSTRATKAREQARQVLAERLHPKAQLGFDSYQLVADWYHFAIMELTRVRDFKSEPAWIAARLGITKKTALAALSRLRRLGLVDERGGRLVALQEFVTSPAGVPSEAIRKNHQQIVEKASRSIHFQSVDERNLSNVILAFDKRQMEEAENMILTFRREFDRKFASSKNRDSVYCLAVQFFGLTDQGKK